MIVITHSAQTNTQRIFAGHHTDDIISLTLHPDGRTVATGQVGKNPGNSYLPICKFEEIIVWDSQTNEKLAVLQGHHERGVCALSFSPDGTQLLSVGLDDKHTIVLWNWKKGLEK